jgi:hypothetical protein
VGDDGSGPFDLGTSVTITPRDRYRYANSAEGVATLPSGGSMIGNVESFLTVDSTSGLSNGMVVWASTGVYAHIIDVVSETSIRVRGGVLGSLAQSEGVSFPAGTILKGAIWVNYRGRAYQIGSTGVTFSVTPGTATADKAATFSVGDQIRIFCAGLGLSEMDNVVNKTEDSASISLYGEKSWSPSVEQRLLTPSRAMHAMNTLIHLSEPVYETQASGCDFMPQTQPGGRVRVWQSYLFNSAWVTHDLVGIEHDLDRGMTRLYMRSVAATSRGAGTAGGGVTGQKVTDRRR